MPAITRFIQIWNKQLALQWLSLQHLQCFVDINWNLEVTANNYLGSVWDISGESLSVNKNKAFNFIQKEPMHSLLLVWCKKFLESLNLRTPLFSSFEVHESFYIFRYYAEVRCFICCTDYSDYYNFSNI